MRRVELIGGPKDGSFVIVSDTAHEVKLPIFRQYASAALPIAFFRINTTVRYTERDNSLEFVYEEL